MKGIVIATIVLGFLVLGACAPVPVVLEIETGTPESRTASPAGDQGAPEPTATPDMVRSMATVERVTVGQRGATYVATISGELRDGCTIIDDVAQEFVGSTLRLVMTAARPRDALCAEAPTPYTRDVVLRTGELPDGVYNLEANGVAAQETIAIAGESSNLRRDNSEETLRNFAPDTIRLDLQGLASSYRWDVRERFAPPAAAMASELPAHIVVTFGGDSLETALSENGRYLLILPAFAYSEVAGEPVAAQIGRLQALLAGADEAQAAAPTGPVPLLPQATEAVERFAQLAPVPFTQGQGVRFVSDAPRGVAGEAWTNEGTAYHYQGLTDDGRFYIALRWPVTTEALPGSAAEAADPGPYAAYLRETQAELDALEPAAWSTDLAQLDALIGSLALVEQATPAPQPTATPEAAGTPETPAPEETPAAATPVIPAGELTPAPVPTLEVTQNPEGQAPGAPAEARLVLAAFGPRGAEAPPLAGTAITAVFGPQAVSGSAGCNTYVAALLGEGNAGATIGAPVVTERTCAEPAGIMEQETAFLEALATTTGLEWLWAGEVNASALEGLRLTYAAPGGGEGVMEWVAN